MSSRRRFLKRAGAGTAGVAAGLVFSFTEAVVAEVPEQPHDFLDIFEVNYTQRTLRWKPGVDQRLTIRVYSASMDHFDLLDQMDDPIPLRWGEHVQRENDLDDVVSTRCAVVNGWTILG